MWLVKTEPGEFGYADLERDGSAVWDGVSNPVALRNLREMREGDQVLVYHTGAEKAVVGVAEVARDAYPDPRRKNPRLVVVDLKPRQRLARPVTLAQIKASPVFQDSPLVRQGRLSVVPISAEQWKEIDLLARSR
jgi:predicted RNA-binding protein with PUA-like domain